MKQVFRSLARAFSLRSTFLGAALALAVTLLGQGRPVAAEELARLLHDTR